MLKTFATVVKIEMSNYDFILNFRPHGGVWTSPINEIVNKKNIEFYGYMIKLSELIREDSASSITVDGNRNYVEVTTWPALYSQDSSFMFYTEDNIKYIAIHFDNFSTPFSKKKIILNTALFFCDRNFRENGTVLKINKASAHRDRREYLQVRVKRVEERIQEINSADIEGNALNFDTLMTNEMTVTLLNHDGLLDNFDNFYGNNFSVYKIYDGQNFEKAKIIYSGFIQKPEYNYLDTVTITAGDIRYTFSNTLTSKVFNIKDYPYLDKFPENVKSGSETIGKTYALHGSFAQTPSCRLTSLALLPLVRVL